MIERKYDERIFLKDLNIGDVVYYYFLYLILPNNRYFYYDSMSINFQIVNYDENSYFVKEFLTSTLQRLK